MLEQRLNELKHTNVLDSPETVDRTVWNHTTMPLSVTLDLLQCKNIYRHLNGANNKILNNLHFDKAFIFLEDHYFQEKLEQYQIPFTEYQLNKMSQAPSLSCLQINLGFMTHRKTLNTTVLLIITLKSTLLSSD